MYIKKYKIHADQNTSSFYYYLLLIFICLACYLPGIVTVPILDRDSAMFSQASKQMVETNRYWQIRFQEKPRHLKPPGIYWLQASIVKIFGDNEINQAWLYRFPSVLGSLLSVLLLFAFSRKIVGDKAALIGAFLLAICLLLTIEAHIATTDAVLLSTMILMQSGLWKIYICIQEKKPVPWQFPFLFWVGMTAGILIKGITPLLGFLTILGLSIFDHNIAWIKKIYLIKGLVLVVLFTLMWLIPLSIVSNSNFLWDMIHNDVMPKLTSGQQMHGEPMGYFLVILMIMFWPASVFLGHAVIYAWKNRKTQTTRFLLAWIIPTWIFFAVVPTKLPEYVLPLYPAIALLSALAITENRENKLQGKVRILVHVLNVIWLMFSLILAGVIMYVTYFLLQSFSFVAIFTGIAVASISVFAFSLMVYQKTQRTVILCVIGAPFIFIMLFQFWLPGLTPLWISREVTTDVHQFVNDKVTPEKPLLVTGYNEPSLVFLLGTRKVLFTPNAAKFLANHVGDVALVSREQQAFFLQTTQQLHLNLKKLIMVTGYNYVLGKRVKLMLYERK